MHNGCMMYADVQKGPIDELIKKHAALVKRIARHLSHRLPDHVAMDDLLQAGMMGLLEAAKKYDAAQGASFETYAGIRIRGAMLDEVRGNDWTPRSVYKKIRQVSEAIKEIENETGCDAKDKDIAKRLDISLDEYYRILNDSVSARVFSFEQNEEESQHNVSSQEEGPLASLFDSRFKDDLVEAIKQLPEREQLLMSLYYNDELNLKEIGLVLEVSESRVCQIHSQALIKLRSKLKEWTENSSQ